MHAKGGSACVRAYACGSCPSLEQEEFRLLFGSYIHVGMRACVGECSRRSTLKRLKPKNKQTMHPFLKKKKKKIEG